MMDWLYSFSNEHFLFELSVKEFFYKIFSMIILISIIPSKKIRLSIYITMVSFSLFQYIHFEYFGKNISAIEFYLFATNLGETFETLGSMLSIMFVPLIIVLFASLLIYLIDSKFNSHIFKLKYGVHLVIIVLLFLSGKVFYISNIKVETLEHHHSKYLYPMINRHSLRNFYVSLNYFTVGILPKKIFGKNSKFSILDKPEIIQKDINRTVVLIIGESLRYDYFTLDNNKLTPKLQTLKEDKNFYFKKIYSGGTMTKVSVSVLINRLKYPEGLVQINNEDNCLFRLAKENNIQTNFISAQKGKYLLMIRDMICPKYIDNLINRDDFEQDIVPTGYDEDLKTMLEKLDISNNSLIVLQHRGSHSPYKRQYPTSFNHYSPYENTALYTDSSLYNLIKYIDSESTQETFIFYVSDHGELLGENGKKGHGHLEKNVYEVPFLMYTNSKSKELRDIFKYVRNHYDISTYITHLLGYKVDLPTKEDREIYIMNSDLDGFSGYGKIKIIDGVESNIEFIRN